MVKCGVVPAPGWDFVGWEGNIDAYDSPVTLEVNQDLTLRAVFIAVPGFSAAELEAAMITRQRLTGTPSPLAAKSGGVYTLTTPVASTNSGYGAVPRSPDASSYEEGTLVGLTASAYLGSRFDRWEGPLDIGFIDDFSDGNHSADPYCSKNGTWTAANYDMVNVNLSTGAQSFFQMITHGDFELRFTYTLDSGGTASPRQAVLQFRDAPATGDRLYLYLREDLAWLRQRQLIDGVYVYTTLDMNTGAQSTVDTPYSVKIVASGADVEVWWGETGAELELALDTSASEVSTGNIIAFLAWPDNFTIHDDILFTTPAVTSVLMDADKTVTAWFERTWFLLFAAIPAWVPL